MNISFNWNALKELIQDLKDLRQKLLLFRSDFSFDQIYFQKISKKIESECHLAVKNILFLKPEKSLTSEKAFEKISSLLSNLKNNLLTNDKKEDMVNTLELLISNLIGMKNLLKKSFDSPNPILKKIIEINKSNPRLPRSTHKTTRVKKTGYTQSKISSFTKKCD